MILVKHWFFQQLFCWIWKWNWTYLCGLKLLIGQKKCEGCERSLTKAGADLTTPRCVEMHPSWRGSTGSLPPSCPYLITIPFIVRFNESPLQCQQPTTSQKHQSQTWTLVQNRPGCHCADDMEQLTLCRTLNNQMGHELTSGFHPSAGHVWACCRKSERRAVPAGKRCGRLFVGLVDEMDSHPPECVACPRSWVGGLSERPNVVPPLLLLRRAAVPRHDGNRRRSCDQN